MVLRDARFDVRDEPRAVAEARDLARATLQDWAVPVDIEAAILLLSEAVTNAVEHGAPPTSVDLHWEDERLRVSVTDACTTQLPVKMTPGQDSERGRGVCVVDAVAERWGVDLGEQSKTFWFEIAR